MPVFYCENCDQTIDLDEDVEHVEECGAVEPEEPEQKPNLLMQPFVYRR